MMDGSDGRGRRDAFVAFMSGEYEFLISIDYIEKIAGADQWREEIPVLDFDRLLRGDRGETQKTDRRNQRHMLVIAAGEVRFGLLVKKVTEIRELWKEEEIPLDPSVINAGNRYLQGVVYTPGAAAKLAYRIDPVGLYHITTGERYDTDETTA